VYTPPGGTANGIGVLLLFGGAWQTGRRDQLRGYGILLGRLGYTCVCGEYRLHPKRSWDMPTDERLWAGDRWPAPLHDVKTAIRWMRASAERLGIDDDKIVVAGISAGAHLALMAAGTPDRAEFEGDGGSHGVSSRLAAVVAVYPGTDLTHITDRNHFAAFLGDDATAEDARLASPVRYVSPNFPPTLLLHGSRDETVRPRESQLMYEALEPASVPVELHLFAGQPHGFDTDPDYARLNAQIMDVFLSRNVGRSEPPQPAL
jgi:acetyl esterase/lipase